MLLLFPDLKLFLVLLGLAALFSLLTLILGADVRLVNERLIFIGCVHTDGLLTILPLRGPAVHLYLRTIFPALVRDQICTTDSATISLIFMNNLLYSVI